MLNSLLSRWLSVPLFAAAILLWISPSPAAAQAFEPDLGQTLDWLQSSEPGDPDVPADAYEVTRHSMADEPIFLPLEEVPGKPFHDIDPPPTKTAYYKYPVYAVLGFPRDLVDGLFGLIGFVPFVNLPVTGVAYEVVPTQILFRDYRDWHGWGGTRNKNDHGWIDSESWGWFPNYNQTKFELVNERKLEQWRAENAELASELQSMNQRIDAHNQAIRSRQETARDYALYWMDNGDPREAVSWILPAHRAYPLNEEIQGVLVASLALYAEDPDAPDWVEPLLWQKLTHALSRVERASESRLEALFEKHPAAWSPARALVYIKTHMAETGEALQIAEAAFNVDPADPDRARLYFEAAMTSREPEKAAVALESLEASYRQRAGIDILADQIGEPRDGMEMLRLRLALLNDQAPQVRETLVAKTERSPSNAYYHYYLACSELAMTQIDINLAERAAMAGSHFEKASLLADNDPLRVRSQVALTFLRSLAGERRDRDDNGGGSLIGF